MMKALMPSKDMLKYSCEESPSKLTVEYIGNWIDNLLNDKIRPSLKSAEPEENVGPMTIIVGSNFEEIVKDTSKDVFVKFYAPWCGHCKTLSPIWDELAEMYKDVEDLKIAKMDYTMNEAEGVSITGYPTVIFYSKHDKKGVKYEGPRDMESMKNWLEDNSDVLKSKRLYDEKSEL